MKIENVVTYHALSSKASAIWASFALAMESSSAPFIKPGATVVWPMMAWQVAGVDGEIERVLKSAPTDSRAGFIIKDKALMVELTVPRRTVIAGAPVHQPMTGMPQ